MQSINSFTGFCYPYTSYAILHPLPQITTITELMSNDTAGKEVHRCIGLNSNHLFNFVVANAALQTGSFGPFMAGKEWEIKRKG